MSKYWNYNSFYELLAEKQTKFTSRICNSVKVNNEWIDYSYQDVLNEVSLFGLHLLLKDVKKEDKVLIYSRNAPEFSVVFFACLSVGAIAVPIDPKMSTKDLESIILHSDARYIVFLNQYDKKKFIEEIDFKKSKLELLEFSHDQYRWSRSIVDELSLYVKVDPEDTAIIIYTSGTTNKPKGVMLTYDNLFYQVEAISKHAFKLKDDLRFLSVLPLNHAFEVVNGFLIPFLLGGEVCYLNSLFPHEILMAMQQKKIREIVCVPLFLRTLRKGIEIAHRKNKITELYFSFGMKLFEKINCLFLKKIYFYPIHKMFGKNLRRIISGGAPLDQETEKFFEVIGSPIYQGYGLTETSPAICINTPEFTRKGTVGKALWGSTIKCNEEDGEVLVKGPLLMKGYYKDDELTRSVIDAEGWLHTGDTGSIDEDGYLTVAGRINDLIVLDNGKKIVPYEVEDQLSENNPYIKEICIIGIRSKAGPLKNTVVSCAVIVLEENYKNISESELIEKLSPWLNSLSSYKKPNKFVIWKHTFEKTSTLKIKRAHLKKQLEGLEYL